MKPEKANGGGPAGYVASVEYTQRAELEAFDHLPKPVRDALRDAPFSMSAAYTLDFYHDHGLDRTMKEIADSITKWREAVQAERNP